MVPDLSTGLSEVQISRIRETISRCQHIKTAILFGSRAMGSHRNGSDIDIALDGEDIRLEDILRLQSWIDDLNLPYFVDLVHIQRIDNPDLLDHIQRVGNIIFTRE